jgi:flagellar assembly protein FliH
LPSRRPVASCDHKGCILIPAGPAPAGDSLPQDGGAAQESENRRRRETERILEERARETRAEADREAYEQGFSQGRRDGLELGRRETAQKIQDLQRLLERLSEQKARICLEAETQLLGLTLALAEEVIRHEVQCQHDIVRESLRAALNRVADNGRLKVSLHPEDLDTIRQSLPQLEGPQGPARRLELDADPAIGRGGCLVETDCGLIDARLEGQWEVIRERFRQILEDRRQAQDRQAHSGERPEQPEKASGREWEGSTNSTA